MPQLAAISSPLANPLLAGVEAPPIAEAQSWVRDRGFPAERPLIDLAQAVPAHPPAPELVAHLRASLADPQIARYTAILGIDPLREALAERTRRLHGGDVSAAETAITAGCNQAAFVALLAAAQAGDNVILTAPYYFNHRMTLSMLGIEARLLPCHPEDGFVPQVDRAAALVDGRTRAILLVTPNNPTGAVMTPGELDGFLAFASRRRLRLILDETYRDFLDPSKPPHDLFRADWRGHLVQLLSFSKVFALAGFRVGGLVADRAFMADVQKIMDCLAICAPHIAQRAALFGLLNLDDWVAGKRAGNDRRIAAFRAAMSGTETGFRIGSIGACFAYLAHPFAGRPARLVAQTLAERQAMLALPGSFFGPDQEGWLRLAFANVSDALMPEIVRRLAAFAQAGLD